MKKKRLSKKNYSAKRTTNTLKYDLELRNDWSEISPREWERLETDEALKEGFLLAIYL